MASDEVLEVTDRPADELVRLNLLERSELEAFAQSINQPAFRGRQLYSWIHGKGVSSFDEMTNLPSGLRTHLTEIAAIDRAVEVHRVKSLDGTIKSVMELSTGARVETVLIPEVKEGQTVRSTVCVSSQVGCAMGCTFCATGLMGFSQNLAASEIVDQVRFMDALSRGIFKHRVTNVVYMGMGEPLMNYAEVVKSIAMLSDEEILGLSPRRVTLSTVGLAKRIQQLADDGISCNLAISLHSARNEKRSEIMPVNRSVRTDISALKSAVKYYHEQTKRRVTYEYCMLDGVNDSDVDAVALAKAAHWAPSKVNLIMYNAVPDSSFAPTSADRLDSFIRLLVEKGVTVTVRRSRGQDIAAACGQLVVN